MLHCPWKFEWWCSFANFRTTVWWLINEISEASYHDGFCLLPTHKLRVTTPQNPAHRDSESGPAGMKCGYTGFVQYSEWLNSQLMGEKELKFIPEIAGCRNSPVAAAELLPFCLFASILFVHSLPLIQFLQFPSTPIPLSAWSLHFKLLHLEI